MSRGGVPGTGQNLPQAPPWGQTGDIPPSGAHAAPCPRLCATTGALSAPTGTPGRDPDSRSGEFFPSSRNRDSLAGWLHESTSFETWRGYGVGMTAHGVPMIA